MYSKNLIVRIMIIMALFFGMMTTSMGQLDQIVLSPSTASNPVGTTHTVVATITESCGGECDTPCGNDCSEPGPSVPCVNACTGILVVFSIISGPNSPFNGTGVTDASGQATFTYTDIGGSGIDEIQASTILNGTEPIFSNIVTKEWVDITKGFMTGGGSIFQQGGARVTHGFELQCDKTKSPNNLEVNWGGNNFHLEELTSAQCHDNQSIEPNPPNAGFDTYKGFGTGRYNGIDGATASWKFTDAGEPGKDDTASIVIKDASDNIVLSVFGKLDKGNQQVHK